MAKEKLNLTKEQIDQIDLIRQTYFGSKLVNVAVTGGKFGPAVVRLDVCNICYQPIKESWDHEKWCAEFVQEDLMKFLEDGIAAKKGRT
jgi:hypothetical protein